MAGELPSSTSQFFSLAFIAVMIGTLVVYIGSAWASCAQLEAFKGSKGGAKKSAAKKTTEHFAGAVSGTGPIDCTEAIHDAAALHDLLASKKVGTEEGPDDLRELDLILSKISCFKRDLMGNGVVNATFKQKFSTAHDLEPVAETTARCFARTIPQRDLELSLDKWGSRGTFLIKRLCTAEALSDAEEKEALRLFGSAMYDVSQVAMGACCNSSEVKMGGESLGRGLSGYEPPALVGLREYKGHY